MHDVQAKATLPAEANHEPNCLEFCIVRPRREIRDVLSPIRIAESLHRNVDWACQLRVDEEGEARLRDEGKRGLELQLVDHGETVAAGIDEEAFEAEDSGAREGQDVLLIASDGSAPGSPVDEAFAFSRCAFFFQSCDRGGFWQAVQRHVDEGRVPTGRRCSRSCAEALPIGASGLVDVDMRVYKARQEGMFAAVMDARVSRNLRRRADGAYLRALDQQRTRLRALRCDDPFREERMCHNLIRGPWLLFRVS